MAEQRGRGRLSSIEMLPPEADSDIQWAVEQLAERKRTQNDILFELNDRLAVIGCEPISTAAFSRYSVRKASALRRLRETREVSKAIVDVLGDNRGDDVTIAIVQLMKEAIQSHLEGGKLAPKALMEMGRALQSVVSAQRMSGDVRQKHETETRKQLDQATEAAADGIAKVRPGLDRDEVLRQIREEVYGIFDRKGDA